MARSTRSDPDCTGTCRKEKTLGCRNAAATCGGEGAMGQGGERPNKEHGVLFPTHLLQLVEDEGWVRHPKAEHDARGEESQEVDQQACQRGAQVPTVGPRVLAR